MKSSTTKKQKAHGPGGKCARASHSNEKISHLGALVLQLKLLSAEPASHMALVRVPAAPLLTQLPLTCLEKQQNMSQMLRPCTLRRQRIPGSWLWPSNPAILPSGQ